MTEASVSDARDTARTRAFIAAHPNEMDRRRIAAALTRRKRYRYVEPTVVSDPDGYRIVSACCSRNLGGADEIVDIALFRWTPETGIWILSWFDRRAREWMIDYVSPRLDLQIERVLADPGRRFWQ